MTKDKRNRNPWFFIPSQYFAEGLPYVLVNNLSVVMYKSLGVANDLIGYTSFLYLPWSLKPLWSPFVDAFATKRKWVIAMQILLGAIFVITALSIPTSNFFLLTIILFTIAAFLSATHDIATDGFYLHALNKSDQAFFSGIRSTFYRLSVIFGSGLLVMFAGMFAGKAGTTLPEGWMYAFILSSVLFALFFIYHRQVLPYPLTDKPVREHSSSATFLEAFRLYFKQEKIAVILAFILIYRLGEGLLVKMAQPFLLDKRGMGGIGLTVGDVGLMYGTVGVIALLAGGILGGWLIKKYGLKRLFWFMALSMNIPNLLYVYLAAFQPDFSFEIFGSIKIYPFIQGCIVIEQFGYGIGFSAYMVYLLYISKGKFKTSHYAISTGFMAVGMMIPGLVSGWLQMHVGYTWLFLLSFIFTIPGMCLIPFLPIKRDDSND